MADEPFDKAREEDGIDPLVNCHHADFDGHKELAFGEPVGAADPLAACRPEDLDAYTEFSRLTVEQRLDWLAAAVEFAVAAREERTGRQSRG